jgi:hypothetical protein
MLPSTTVDRLADAGPEAADVDAAGGVATPPGDGDVAEDEPLTAEGADAIGPMDGTPETPAVAEEPDAPTPGVAPYADDGAPDEPPVDDATGDPDDGATIAEPPPSAAATIAEWGTSDPQAAPTSATAARPTISAWCRLSGVPPVSQHVDSRCHRPYYRNLYRCSPFGDTESDKVALWLWNGGHPRPAQPRPPDGLGGR